MWQCYTWSNIVTGYTGGRDSHPMSGTSPADQSPDLGAKTLDTNVALILYSSGNLKY